VYIAYFTQSIKQYSLTELILSKYKMHHVYVPLHRWLLRGIPLKFCMSSP